MLEERIAGASRVEVNVLTVWRELRSIIEPLGVCQVRFLSTIHGNLMDIEFVVSAAGIDQELRVCDQLCKYDGPFAVTRFGLPPTERGRAG